MLLGGAVPGYRTCATSQELLLSGFALLRHRRSHMTLVDQMPYGRF